MLGLINRLLGRTKSLVPNVEATFFSGGEPLDVVGEAAYQDALWRIVGGRSSQPIRHPVRAVLLPEPTNAQDPNAIMVRADGHLVGYLAREDAAAYLPGLLALMASCPTGHVELEGQIVGGGPRGDRIGFLGIFLDHNPADFRIAPHYTTGGSLRTGLSQAIATDLDDNTYDLSWLPRLAEDDLTAIDQLRTLLDDERDPIDRHYMLCELESRLYRRRNASPSALDEYDAVCQQHHEEMNTILPALLDKFGAVPVIEMYRQAAIRCQKARQWEKARAWAQRGIDIYGDNAARPEILDDLHKRIAHADAKIDAGSASSRPPRVQPKPADVTAELETLLCRSCGATFTRERTRGRKPRRCPTCRGSTSPRIVS